MELSILAIQLDRRFFRSSFDPQPHYVVVGTEKSTLLSLLYEGKSKR